MALSLHRRASTPLGLEQAFPVAPEVPLIPNYPPLPQPESNQPEKNNRSLMIALGALGLAGLFAAGAAVVSRGGNEKPQKNEVNATVSTLALPETTPTVNIFKEKGVFFGAVPEGINQQDYAPSPEDLIYEKSVRQLHPDLAARHQAASEQSFQIFSNVSGAMDAARGTCVSINRQAIDKSGKLTLFSLIMVNPEQQIEPQSSNIVTYSAANTRGEYIDLSIKTGPNKVIEAAIGAQPKDIKVIDLPSHKVDRLYPYVAVSSANTAGLSKSGIKWVSSGFVASPFKRQSDAKASDLTILGGVIGLPPSSTLTPTELTQVCEAAVSQTNS